MVTDQQVKAACLAAGIEYVEHHSCSICGYMTAYVVVDGDLYFDPGCDCGHRAPYQPRNWQDAADHINRQQRSGQHGDVAAREAAKFGIKLEPIAT